VSVTGAKGSITGIGSLISVNIGGRSGSRSREGGGLLSGLPRAIARWLRQVKGSTYTGAGGGGGGKSPGSARTGPGKSGGGFAAFTASRPDLFPQTQTEDTDETGQDEAGDTTAPTSGD
jgi:hypothetical protein